jgi:hypothetical protein
MVMLVASVLAWASVCVAQHPPCNAETNTWNDPGPEPLTGNILIGGSPAADGAREEMCEDDPDPWQVQIELGADVDTRFTVVTDPYCHVTTSPTSYFYTIPATSWTATYDTGTPGEYAISATWQDTSTIADDPDVAKGATLVVLARGESYDLCVHNAGVEKFTCIAFTVTPLFIALSWNCSLVPSDFGVPDTYPTCAAAVDAHPTVQAARAACESAYQAAMLECRIENQCQ